MSEQEIIALLLQQDERGMDALLRHYGPLLRYVIAPILPDPQDREECLYETAMQIWNKAAQYDPQRGSWSAWLTAIARNLALNRLRKPVHSSEALTEQIPSPAPSPEESMIRQERQTALHRALEQVSSADRTLFYRKYYYLQSTAQIAAELGMTERAVEGRLYRLKKRLRKKLGGDSDA